MWNILDLKCPSSDIVEYQSQDKCQIEKLSDFATVLLEAGNILASDDPLWHEIHVLKNIQAKYRRILHCDKCLVYLHRVSQCVKKMVLLNLSLSYRELAERLLIGLHDRSDMLHLPSQQQVEYVMIRTQSAAMLVTEAVRYSQDTFCFLIQKLKVGHHILDLHMATGVTARINIMLKGILIQLHNIYQKVYKGHTEFKKGTFKWPRKLNLPKNLEKWITAFESNLKKPFPITKLDEKLLASYSKSKDDRTESDADSVTVIDAENDADCLIMEGAEDTDIGEVIPRKGTSLSPLQDKLLRKIVLAPGIESLEDLWKSISKLRPKCLPTRLSEKKRKIISNFLTRTKVRRAKSARLLKKNPQKDYRSFITAVSTMLAKYLGFTHEQIHACRNIFKNKEKNLINFIGSESADVLNPVKTLRKLMLQYELICSILLSENNVKKYKKIRNKFKRKIADIKLLKQSGEIAFAKDLTLCTSKVILTLYKKS